MWIVRIIAGTARGRPFEAPEGRSTRPTLDRVREAMFGMVQFDVADAEVLDLFAGSGALGLEALSRGAKSAFFCDHDRKACSLIEKNLRNLGFFEKAEIACSDCFELIRSLAKRNQRFSLVLLDPPYESGLYEPVLRELVSNNLLEDGCIILAEHSKNAPLEPPVQELSAGKQHRYGDVAVTKFTYHREIIISEGLE